MTENSIPVPDGYAAVEHGDGVIHALDMGNIRSEVPWRTTPVCGRATGVSSDEAGPDAMARHVISCWECISIISPSA